MLVSASNSASSAFISATHDARVVPSVPGVHTPADEREKSSRSASSTASLRATAAAGGGCGGSSSSLSSLSSTSRKSCDGTSGCDDHNGEDSDSGGGASTSAKSSTPPPCIVLTISYSVFGERRPFTRPTATPTTTAMAMAIASHPSICRPAAADEPGREQRVGATWKWIWKSSGSVRAPETASERAGESEAETQHWHILPPFVYSAYTSPPRRIRATRSA